jgi:hypothetical protein
MAAPQAIRERWQYSIEVAVNGFGEQIERIVLGKLEAMVQTAKAMPQLPSVKYGAE